MVAMGASEKRRRQASPFGRSLSRLLAFRAGHIEVMGFRHLGSPEETEATRVLLNSIFNAPTGNVPGLDVGRAYISGEHPSCVGGDIIDTYLYDSGAVSLAIADISGKGSYAAVFAGLVKFALRAYASRGFQPEETIRSLNRLFLETKRYEGIEDALITAFHGYIDPTRRLISYASAGHEPVLLLHPDGSVHDLRATGRPLGISTDENFDQDFAALYQGSLLVAVTDGVTEARDPSGNFAGSQPTLDIVRRSSTQSAQAIADAILEATLRHVAGGPIDDIAILVLRVVQQSHGTHVTVVT